MDLALKAEGKMMKKKKEDGSASVVRWERFLPRMVLRVMLVEADDSTRQIIAALLRKCSYRGKISYLIFIPNFVPFLDTFLSFFFA